MPDNYLLLFLFTITISPSVLIILPNKLAQEPFFFFFKLFYHSHTLGNVVRGDGEPEQDFTSVCACLRLRLSIYREVHPF